MNILPASTLVEAGFSDINFRHLIYNPRDSNCFLNLPTCYETKKWARNKDKDGRLPLCIAAVKSLKWLQMKDLFAANKPAVYNIDTVTRLPVFMLTAVGPTSDIESVYNYLREHPPAILCLNNRE